jgi:protein-disulfide isomerase
MRNVSVFAAAWIALSLGSVYAAEGPAPKLDKPRLETYLRYAEGYSAGVKFDIEDPKPSPFPGYFKVLVHLTYGSGKIERSYYMTPDGEHFINGSIWDLKNSPFEDALLRIPKDGYAFGPENAKVTIVVFSDFQCPYCKNLAKTIRDNLPKNYPSDVRVVFKDFPIASIHPWAHAAAEAAHCVAGDDSKLFWGFHDWIFEHQQDIKGENLREKVLGFAKEQKLDDAKIASCMDTHATAAVVDSSIKAGEMLQLQQTPTVFINGRNEPGAIPWNALDSLIKLELNRPKEIPGPMAENCCEVAIPKVGH